MSKQSDIIDLVCAGLRSFPNRFSEIIPFAYDDEPLKVIVPTFSFDEMGDCTWAGLPREKGYLGLVVLGGQRMEWDTEKKINDLAFILNNEIGIETLIWERNGGFALAINLRDTLAKEKLTAFCLLKAKDLSPSALERFPFLRTRANAAKRAEEANGLPRPIKTIQATLRDFGLAF